MKNITRDYAKGLKIKKFNKLNKTKKLVSYNNYEANLKDGKFSNLKLLKTFAKKFI